MQGLCFGLEVDLPKVWDEPGDISHVEKTILVDRFRDPWPVNIVTNQSQFSSPSPVGRRRNWRPTAPFFLEIQNIDALNWALCQANVATIGQAFEGSRLRNRALNEPLASVGFAGIGRFSNQLLKVRPVDVVAEPQLRPEIIQLNRWVVSAMDYTPLYGTCGQG